MNYLHRWIEHPLLSPASSQKIRLLLGARQTGKSTLMRRVAAQENNPVLVDLQDSGRRQDFERRPRAFTEFLLGLNGHRLVCVDEIQKVPKLLEEIQWLHDHHPRRFRFLLTGSSARKLRASSANLLPGRSHVFHLTPLFLPEYGCASQVLPLPGILQKPQFDLPKLPDLLTLGGLPSASIESRASAMRTIESYAELYLEEEIRREGLVKDTGSFGQFLELAALESSQVMNLTHLSNESGIAITTLRLYYQVLVDTFVGYWLPPHRKPGRKRLLTTPKFFFFDLGVRNACARLPLNPSLVKLQKGQLFEHWVGLELIHRAMMLGKSYRVGFWKTVGGAEVDFVIETPREVIPVEVKATEKPSLSDARHLELFFQDEPRAKRGFVVCQVPEIRRLSKRVLAIPWNLL